MAFSLTNIAKEQVLKDLDEKDLKTLLASDPAFTIPLNQKGALDCRKLAEQLMLPDELPEKLANALYYVDVMATPEGADVLESAFQSKYPDFSFAKAHICSVEYSIKAWLKDKDLLKRVLAESSVENIQATDVFRGPSGKTLKKVTAKQRTALEKAMSNWFSQNRRGKKVSVSQFERASALWFVFRRGDAYKREVMLDQTSGDSVPSFGYKELHDIIIYDPDNNDLQIHADGIKVKRQYAFVFGLVLFDDGGAFTPGDMYTLEYLLKNKNGALNCGGIPNLKGATLTRIEYPVGNQQNEKIIHLCDDVLEAFDERDKTLHPSCLTWASIDSLSQATIKLDIGEVDGVHIGERTLRITPPGRVLYKRDRAAQVIDQFLRENGYVLDRPGGGDAEESS